MDEDLVNRVCEGDRQCFGGLVERYWRMAAGLALARVGNPADAEDIAQESFMRAYSHLGSLREPSRFAGWLARIVSQVATDHLRAQARRRHTALPATAEAVLAAPNPGLSPAQRKQIRTAVGQLAALSQQVIVMRFVEGFSTKQIAQQLGRRPGAIRVRLHRAYGALRTALGAMESEGNES
jgi:RNA polymerase sigma-70 factor (ECF subfamily)